MNFPDFLKVPALTSTSPKRRALAYQAPSKEFKDALDDLKEIEDEARDSGYRVPERCAIKNAERVLSWLKHHPRLMVYPFENGDVGVDAASVRANKRRVLVVCAGDGSAMCLVHVEKPSRRLWCAAVDDVKMVSFVKDAVLEMDDPDG